ncbi:MAG TPA: LysM peptidoglycan-binding domain-containing protein [Chloroflexota bacterium]|nr:LysM peptidoglycan-binding domain-containing protein [Chloroflexota bacterium]
MQEYVSAPERRFPSPSAQRRSGEHWKARVGLGFVIVLTLCSAAIMFRIAGMGVGSAASSLRGPAPAATQRPAAQPTAGGQAGAPAGQAAPAAATAAPAVATATAAPQATAARTPTPAAGQREHIVAAGDTLSAIATRYNTTVQAIIAANNLPSSNTILNIGQRLIIPA